MMRHWAYQPDGNARRAARAGVDAWLVQLLRICI
jgi:hypothetical protein